MRLVYRIEHYRVKQDICGMYETYRGPFDPLSRRMDDDARDRMYQPSGPRDDWWNSFTGRTHVFGCPSISALLEWFDDEILRELMKCGYRIAVYEVANDNLMVCPQGIQCSFRADLARRVGRRIRYNGEESITRLRSAKAA